MERAVNARSFPDDADLGELADGPADEVEIDHRPPRRKKTKAH